MAPISGDFDEDSRNVDRFLIEQIDTVPHLEALLLLWNSRPGAWSSEDMAKSLYIGAGLAESILKDLARKGLVTTEGASFYYQPEPRRDLLVGSIEVTYRRELIRISRLIHTKPSAAIRDFARAFRLKKDE